MNHREPAGCLFCDRQFTSKQGRAHHERLTHPGMVTEAMYRERVKQSQRESLLRRGRSPHKKRSKPTKWVPTPERRASAAKYRASARGKAQLFATHSNERARPFAVVGRLTVAAVLSVPAEACAYCGTTEELGWDHVVPLSRGGANLASNLVSCCLPCNKRKAHRTAEEFAAAA